MNICTNCKHYIERSYDDNFTFTLCDAFIDRVDPINGFIAYRACQDLRYKDGQVVDCGHYEEKKPWWKMFDKLKKLWKRKN